MTISASKVVIFAFMLSLCLGMGGSVPTPDPRNQRWEVAVDPHKVMGVQSCEKCHASEIQTWKKTPHNETFLTLHRKPEAQQIASKLGIENFKSDSNCIQCHYTMSTNQGRGPQEAIAGISCESCHGASKDWIAVHNDYGGANVTKAQETREHRLARFQQSIQLGMRNPVNVYLLAQSVSWSQGTVRHNFLRTDGQTNAEETPARLRQLFVAGMIADLEFSMRATSKATQKATFGITSAQRTQRALDRLKSAQEKLQQPILQEIIDIASNVKLKLNNRESLQTAAAAINELGVKFGATVRGDDLTAIESFIPPKDKWK